MVCASGLGGGGMIGADNSGLWYQLHRFVEENEYVMDLKTEGEKNPS